MIREWSKIYEIHQKQFQKVSFWWYKPTLGNKEISITNQILHLKELAKAEQTKHK